MKVLVLMMAAPVIAAVLAIELVLFPLWVLAWPMAEALVVLYRLSWRNRS